MSWPDDALKRLTLIADIVERFALLEHYIRRTLLLLLSADPVAAHVFATQASAGEMITSSERILKESARKGVDRGSPELRDALKAASAALVRRNDLLHNLTMQYTDENGADIAEVHKLRRHQDQPVVVPVQLNDLWSIYVEANAAINALRLSEPKHRSRCRSLTEGRESPRPVGRGSRRGR